MINGLCNLVYWMIYINYDIIQCVIWHNVFDLYNMLYTMLFPLTDSQFVKLPTYQFLSQLLMSVSCKYVVFAELIAVKPSEMAWT